MMRQPNQVPVIGQQRQQFQTAINQQLQQLSLSIYTQLATQYLGSIEDGDVANPEHLQQLSKDSQVAARSFFEGMGVQFE